MTSTLSAVANKSAITLKGSAQIVSEFLGYSINSILYQRGIYDADSFRTVKKYDLKLFVSADEGLNKYLEKVLSQMEDWLERGIVKKLVLVISSVENSEVLERWVFDVETDQKVLETGESKQKPEKEIQREISAILRQIAASVSYLPMLDCACSFDLLVYTSVDCSVPAAWEESDPRYINNANEVRLRSFSTKVHKVDTSVSYRADA